MVCDGVADGPDFIANLGVCVWWYSLKLKLYSMSVLWIQTPNLIYISGLVSAETKDWQLRLTMLLLPLVFSVDGTLSKEAALLVGSIADCPPVTLDRSYGNVFELLEACLGFPMIRTT